MNEFAKGGWKVVSLVRDDSTFQRFIVTLERQHGADFCQVAESIGGSYAFLMLLPPL